MSVRLSQVAFVGGEIGPSLYARSDLEKYGQSLKTAYNVIIHRYGGATGRAGTNFVCEVDDSSYAHRLIPFEFNTEQNYITVWGDGTMRIVMEGAEVLDDSQDIESITNDNPGVIGITGHGYNDGDKVYASGVGGMTELDAQFYYVDNKTTDTFTLTDLYGTAIDTTNFGTFTSGGVIARVTTVTVPYQSNADPNNAGAEPFFMDYAQSNDVMFIAHLDYAPRQLTRTDHNSWTIGAQSIGATIAAPGSISATATTGSGSITYNYTVTAHNDETGEESVAGTADNCTNDLSADPTYKNTITWGSVTNATRYSVYKEDNGLFGYIGGTTSTSFVDGVPTEITPDLAFTPPENNNPFDSSGNYPATVEFHEARLVYAQTDNQPGAFWMSQPVKYSNFNKSTPARSDDVVSGRLLPGVNAIQGMASLSSLCCFTSNAEFTLSGSGVTQYITPASLTPSRWSRNGSDRLQPLVCNEYALYVHKQGRQIYAFGIGSSGNRFESQDVTLLAPHLFEGHFIQDWCYQHDPHLTVWMVRDDGKLILLTFMPDQNVFAFALCELAASDAGAAVVESVACISGPNEDEVYFEVKRTINGVTKRYVEVLASLNWGDDVADFWGLDCALLYEGDPINTVTGVPHLEGETAVAALADGFLVTELTVTNGAIELSTDDFPDGASTILVGLLPSAPILEPLPVAQPDVHGATQGRRKRVTGVTLKLQKSCGVWAGSTSETAREMKLRKASVAAGTPTPPVTGDYSVKFDPKHSKDGTFIIKGTAGLPMTVLALYPDVEVSNANAKLTDS